MTLTPINVIKQDDRGVIYDCGKANFIFRKKGSVSADHKHEDAEVIYLVAGEVELTIGEETQTVKAPIRFEMQSNEYHKLVALTDISLVIDRATE